MRVDVLYFAAARERAGTDRESFGLELGTVQALAEAVTARHPNLAPLLPRLRFAVNRTFVRGNAVVGDGDEVALIPPVTGGSGRYATFNTGMVSNIYRDGSDRPVFQTQSR